MSEEAEMKIDPARAKTLVTQLQGVSERVAAAAKGRNVRGNEPEPRPRASSNPLLTLRSDPPRGRVQAEARQ